MKKKIIATVFLAVMLLSGCQSTNAGDAASKVVRESSQSDVVTMHKSGMLPKYSYEDLLEKASVIATVSLVEASAPFEIQSVSGAISSFTDYTMEVVEPIKGNVMAGESIVVRLEGGRVDNLNVVVEENPEIMSDSKMLLFLYQPGMGGSYNTEGDYYYVLGMNQGAFYSENRARAVDENFTNELGLIVNKNTLKLDVEALSTVNGEKANNSNWVYEEFVDNQQKNLESGFITQEEYELLLKESSQYATIIN